MSGVISEDYLSRRFKVGRSADRELVYNVTGTDDEAEVLTLIEGAAPAVYQGLVLDSIDAEAAGGAIWKGYARYTTQENDNEYTFDTTGGTSKVTQSLSTIASYAPTGMTPPDFQGAIGVSDDRVEGVDVPVPQFSFTETHRFADGSVDGTYKRNLFLLTGCFNDDDFKGFSAGECMFLGATGTKRGDDLWSITYRFAGSPNVSGMTIGDITGIDKLGWDYLWVRYADFADTAAFSLVKRPVAVYVERVSQPGDFSLLNIGT